MAVKRNALGAAVAVQEKRGVGQLEMFTLLFYKAPVQRATCPQAAVCAKVTMPNAMAHHPAGA